MERLTISANDWHRLKSNRKVPVSASSCSSSFSSRISRRKLSQDQQAAGWLDRFTAPPCPTHGHRQRQDIPSKPEPEAIIHLFAKFQPVPLGSIEPDQKFRVEYTTHDRFLLVHRGKYWAGSAWAREDCSLGRQSPTSNDHLLGKTDYNEFTRSRLLPCWRHSPRLPEVPGAAPLAIYTESLQQQIQDWTKVKS